MIAVGDVATELRGVVLSGPMRMTSTVRLVVWEDVEWSVRSRPSSPLATRASGPLAQRGSRAPNPTGNAIRAIGRGVVEGALSEDGLEGLGKFGCVVHCVN